MIYHNPILEIHSLGKFLKWFTTPIFMFDRIADKSRWFIYTSEEDLPPSEDIPIPEGDEIFPNQGGSEDEYVPEKKEEVPIEEPKKEIEDPSFPGKEDDAAIKKVEEFPQNDPI